MTKTKIILILLVILLLILSVVYILATRKNQALEPISPEDSAAIKESAVQLPEINEVPRVPDSQGGGIDTESAVVKLSMQSLNKLQPLLPFSKTVTSPDGIEVEVVIPPLELVSNDWTLLVHVFGPDYQVSPDDPEYNIMQKAFLSGAGETIAFLDQNGINMSEIIIQWGDRAIITERSEQWLKE